MRVKMLTNIRNPDGGPGSIVDVDDARGLGLIEKGYAESIQDPARRASPDSLESIEEELREGSTEEPPVVQPTRTRRASTHV